MWLKGPQERGKMSKKLYFDTTSTILFFSAISKDAIFFCNHLFPELASSEPLLKKN